MRLPYNFTPNPVYNRRSGWNLYVDRELFYIELLYLDNLVLPYDHTLAPTLKDDRSSMPCPSRVKWILFIEIRDMLYNLSLLFDPNGLHRYGYQPNVIILASVLVYHPSHHLHLRPRHLSPWSLVR